MATTHSSSQLLTQSTIASTFVTTRDRIDLASDLLPPVDIIAVLAATLVSVVVYAMSYSMILHSPFTMSMSVGSWLQTFVFEWVPSRALSVATDNWGIVALSLTIAPFVLYDEHFAADVCRQHLNKVMRAYVVRMAAFWTLMIALGIVTNTLKPTEWSWLVVWATSVIFVTGFVRWRAARAVTALAQRGELKEAIAIVGNGPRALQLYKDLLGFRHIEVIGWFSDMDQRGAAMHTQSAGSTQVLIRLMKEKKIDWVLIAATHVDESLQETIRELQKSTARVALCASSHAWRTNQVQSADDCAADFVGNGMPVLLHADRPIKRWSVFAKRAEDLVLGTLLLMVLSPVLAAIAVAIKLDSRGPIIFKQQRHAFNNSEFAIYKFRTMYSRTAPDEKLRQTERDDPRVTRVGRWLRQWSLDELPQLLNVMKGEMSLVGPRPHAVNMQTESRFGWEITDRYAHRHRVKPGMTGWSQVNGARGPTDTIAQLQRRIELDLFYIENWSLLFDLKILFMTVRVVASRTNAY